MVKVVFNLAISVYQPSKISSILGPLVPHRHPFGALFVQRASTLMRVEPLGALLGALSCFTAHQLSHFSSFGLHVGSLGGHFGALFMHRASTLVRVEPFGTLGHP